MGADGASRTDSFCTLHHLLMTLSTVLTSSMSLWWLSSRSSFSCKSRVSCTMYFFRSSYSFTTYSSTRRYISCCSKNYNNWVNAVLFKMVDNFSITRRGLFLPTKRNRKNGLCKFSNTPEYSETCFGHHKNFLRKLAVKGWWPYKRGVK